MKRCEIDDDVCLEHASPLLTETQCLEGLLDATRLQVLGEVAAMFRETALKISILRSLSATYTARACNDLAEHLETFVTDEAARDN